MAMVFYSWSEGNNLIAGNTSSNQLDLSPLDLSRNETQYTCHFEASSVYRHNSIMVWALPSADVRHTTMGTA